MNDWISVEDRLPESGAYIAVWITPSDNPKKAFWTNSTFWNGEFEVKGSHHSYKQVTHWMKIEPPNT